MDHIYWNDSFSIGEQEIDNQHNKLFNIRNRLADCCTINNALWSEDFHRILGELFEYARIHFKAEEAYMQLLSYPDFLRHQDQHNQFFNTHVVFLAEFVLSPLDISVVEKEINYLTDWLVTHILESDMPVRYYREGRLNNNETLLLRERPLN